MSLKNTISPTAKAGQEQETNVVFFSEEHLKITLVYLLLTITNLLIMMKLHRSITSLFTHMASF